jgi:hypothetical protein
MRWSVSVGMLVLALVATACAQPAAAPPSAASGSSTTASQASAPVAPAGNAGAVSQAPSQPAAVAIPVSWQRPADVAPLPADAKFDVIADAPWPGQKVRVFFFGIQG